MELIDGCEEKMNEIQINKEARKTNHENLNPYLDNWIINNLLDILLNFSCAGKFRIRCSNITTHGPLHVR